MLKNISHDSLGFLGLYELIHLHILVPQARSAFLKYNGTRRSPHVRIANRFVFDIMNNHDAKIKIDNH